MHHLATCRLGDLKYLNIIIPKSMTTQICWYTVLLLYSLYKNFASLQKITGNNLYCFENLESCRILNRILQNFADGTIDPSEVRFEKVVTLV